MKTSFPLVGMLWFLSMVMIIITPSFRLFGMAWVDVAIIECLNIVILLVSQWVSK